MKHPRPNAAETAARSSRRTARAARAARVAPADHRRHSLVEPLEGRRLLSTVFSSLTGGFDTDSVPEGGSATFTFAATGTPGGSFYVYEYANGSRLGRGTQTFDASGQYQNGGPGTPIVRSGGQASGITTTAIELVDLESGSSIRVTDDLVTTNVAPAIARFTTSTSQSGNMAFFGVEITDPGLEPTMTAVVDFGDGTTTALPLERSASRTNGVYTYRSTTASNLAPHAYALPDLYRATVTVSDDEASVAATKNLEIGEYLPAYTGYKLTYEDGTRPSDYFFYEGETVVVAGTYYVPRPDRGLTVTVNWGDDAVPQSVTIAPEEIVNNVASFRVSRTFGDDTGESLDPYDNLFYPDGLYGSISAVDGAGNAPAYSNPARLSTYVANVAPTAALTPSAASFDAGTTFGLSAVVTDPGVLDSQSVVIDWGDGTSETVELPADGTEAKSLELSHVYADASAQGTPYQITVTSTDDDGGTSTATAEVAVTESAPPPPANPVTVALDGTTLNVTGTDADDTITFAAAGAGLVSVVANGVASGPFSANLVVVDARNGNDTVDGSALSIPIRVNGGAGDDSLVGGSNSDVLNGDAGNDVITGGAGLWDVLAGGDGNDLLTDSDGVLGAVGGNGNDVLDLKFSKNWAALPGLSPTNANYRVMPGLVQGNAGNDVIRLNADAGNPAIAFVLFADDLVTTGGSGNDTVVLLGNYRNGSSVVLDSLISTTAGYRPVGYDYLFASHGGINTNGDASYSLFANQQQADNAVNAAIQALLNAFRA